MPKVKRSQEDREIIREKILDEALTLISEHGFTSFSMRKLASRLGLTATTIYNYYSNKDELYLMILTRGFEMLCQRFEKISLGPGEPFTKLKEMVRAYIDFGTNKAHYYNIMFTSDAPKYRDYIGTDIEPIAYVEKQTALKLIIITSGVLNDFLRPKGRMSDQEVRYFIIKLWSTLHGVIALYNSRVLPEVDEHPEQIIDQVAEDVLRPLLPLATGKSSEKPLALNTAL
jgi:AcrR family transcriptional regulator